MPDAPDGFAYRPTSQRHVLGDLGELAVRLGSVVSYHRSGTVVFADGMENGLVPYLPQSAGSGASVAVDTTLSFQGAKSVKCTGATDTTALAGLLKRIQPLTIHSMGFEVTFSCESVNRHFMMSVQHNTPGLRDVFGIRFWVPDNEILYKTSSNTWVAVADYELSTDDKYLFHSAKLVVDLINAKYVKMFIDQTEIDLSAYSAYSPVDTTQPRLEFMAGVSSKSGENNVAYIDNYIITTDEP